MNDEELRRYRVILQPEALAAIDEAFSRFQLSHLDFARQWVKGVWEAIRSLETLPLRCPLARENPYFEEEVRHLLYRQSSTVYRIIFTIVKDDTVSVVSVRHTAQEGLKSDKGPSKDYRSLLAITLNR
jgi:hypothetical protein